ncbi:integrase [Rhodanobacter sp. Root561]|uniref:DNA-binding protein n=1 Tax=Rhodanobacter sp. Root561 TaxID=1736560 RepID=UPI0006FCBD2C|nr:DNA-binding protein [Rhodanobacter sp. Root561]KQZ77703.1 integrase [Rhodanobacter sp. Root561]
MSRVSDTRQRTREAAAQLVAGAKRPHEITVDQIYAVIQQGSRTTINDELKLWKDERTKVDALGADLPPAVADAMRSLWVAAVEQGERTFTEQREAMEAELSSIQLERDEARASRDATIADGQQRAQQATQLGEQLTELQQRLVSESATKNDALGQVHALQQEIASLRTESMRQQEATVAAQEKQSTEFQARLAERDLAFQTELGTATQRLEAAQDHMLRQIDEAREGQRHAERALAKAQRRHEEQQTELTELRLRYREQLQKLEQQRAQIEALTTERQTLMQQVQSNRGQIDGMELALQLLAAKASGTRKSNDDMRKPAQRKRRVDSKKSAKGL